MQRIPEQNEDAREIIGQKLSVRNSFESIYARLRVIQNIKLEKKKKKGGKFELVTFFPQ